jgi:hypothetical protein
MGERQKCTMCEAGEIEVHSGRLDQSGETYLPTTVWCCGTCGFTRFAPALGVRWRAAEGSAPLSAVPAHAA